MNHHLKYLLEDKSRTQNYSAILERELRKMVKDEIEQTIQRSPHLIMSRETSVLSRSPRLCIKGETKTIYTKNNIEDEGVMLELELCDDTGKKLENVDPEMNNLKVRISALEGFMFDDSDNYTEKDFDSHVAKPRNGKPSVVLDGNCDISMANGFASVGGIIFTDNSRVERPHGTFKLGAKVIKGLPPGSIVRPAVTKAFRVKENRGKGGEKNLSPSPNDDISRLHNIIKTGKIYQRAENVNIKTVLHFLQLYNTNPKKLQDILRLKGKKWTRTVNNAKACKLTNNLCKYIYRDDASGNVLLLKCDFDIESVAFRGQKHQPYDSLTGNQKEIVCKLREAAYEKRGELEKVDASINQIPVQDGLGCLYNVERQIQQQATSTLPPSIKSPAYLHLDTTVTDYDNCQQGEMNTSASSITGAYGVQDAVVGAGNYTNAAIGNMNQLVATNQAQYWSLSDINHQGVMNTSICGGQRSQLNEPIDDILEAQIQPEKTWASVNQSTVHKERTHPSYIIQQNRYLEHQQQQLAVATPNAASGTPNVGSHEFTQMCSSNSFSKTLPVEEMLFDPGNMFEYSPGNVGSLKEFEWIYSINVDDRFEEHPITIPPQEERSNGSACDSVASKLITTVYLVRLVKKAAIQFMMSLQKNPSSASPMKKRKLQ